jgi:hypothetical protein
MLELKSLFALRPGGPDHHIAAASGAGPMQFFLVAWMGPAPANAAHVVIDILIIVPLA